MGYNINHVEITLDINEEFMGHHDLIIKFVPTDADAPLMALIEAKHAEQYAAMIASLRQVGGASDIT